MNAGWVAGERGLGISPLADEIAAGVWAVSRSVDEVFDVALSASRRGDSVTGFAHGGTNLVEMGWVSRHADERFSWSSSACRVGTSSTPGTLADGTKEEIELVVVGDGVLATDTETGSTAAREVKSMIAGTGDRTLVEVVTTDGGVVVATSSALSSGRRSRGPAGA